jgi:AraC-like DNA-binding protein
MKAMKVSFTQPEQQLSPYVALIWVFESSSGVPLADSRIIVPDGRAKIIVPYRNSLCAAVSNRLLNAKEHQIFLVGIQSNPTTIASTATDTGTIGVELTPKGLYHLFKLSMHEITNRMVSFEEVFGPRGARLQTRVGDAEDPQEKIAILQSALAHLLQQNAKEYALLDHTLDLLAQTHGMMRVQELAAHTGYTKRYLDRLFQEHVGVSPKSLASIMRFQEVYRDWMQHQSPTFFRNHWSAYYYDQAHFIKEFKRFTGFTPQHYTAIVNEFGRAFHSQQ